MGLDTVELVMRIEEEFSIGITDAAAMSIVTVGDIHAYILQVLQDRGEVPDGAKVWDRLKEIVVDQLGVRSEDVVPTARIVEDLGAD